MRETIADITKAVLDFTGTEHPEHPMDIRYPLVIIDGQGRTWACRYWGGYYYQCMDDPNLVCMIGGLADQCKSRDPRVWDAAAAAQIRKVVEFNPHFDTPAQVEIVDLRCAGKGGTRMDGGVSDG